MNMLSGMNPQTIKAANDMRVKQQKFQKLLEEVQVTGQSKNGKVVVKVSGNQKLLSVNIDKDLINFVHENFTSLGNEDTMISKAVMEGVDDAMQKVQMAIVTKMQESGNMGELMEMLSSVAGK
jgi:DNA-binding protein YbaB